MCNVHFVHHCCSVPLPLDAIGFENGCPITKELICSAFGVKIVNDGYAIRISLTTEHGTILARWMFSIASEVRKNIVYSRLKHRGEQPLLALPTQPFCSSAFLCARTDTRKGGSLSNCQPNRTQKQHDKKTRGFLRNTHPSELNIYENTVNTYFDYTTYTEKEQPSTASIHICIRNRLF